MLVAPLDTTNTRLANASDGKKVTRTHPNHGAVTFDDLCVQQTELVYFGRDAVVDNFFTCTHLGVLQHGVVQDVLSGWLTLSQHEASMMFLFAPLFLFA
jgi:hypothetical protein